MLSSFTAKTLTALVVYASRFGVDAWSFGTPEKPHGAVAGYNSEFCGRLKTSNGTNVGSYCLQTTPDHVEVKMMADYGYYLRESWVQVDGTVDAIPLTDEQCPQAKLSDFTENRLTTSVNRRYHVYKVSFADMDLPESGDSCGFDVVVAGVASIRRFDAATGTEPVNGWMEGAPLAPNPVCDNLNREAMYVAYHLDCPSIPPPVVVVDAAPLIDSSISRHVCILRTSGAVVCFGSNVYGQLGVPVVSNGDKIGDAPNEMGKNLVEVNLGAGRTALRVVTGQKTSCAILNNGNVLCWGHNFYGQLGPGIQTPQPGTTDGYMGSEISFGTGRTAKSIDIGRNFVCVLLDNASISCWGSNNDGQLGRGDTAPSNVPQIVDIGAGRTPIAITLGVWHVCTLLIDGKVVCWGRGSRGRLGVGSSTNIGNEANEMGDRLASVRLPSGRKCTQLVAGSDHNCCLLDNDDVVCWGYGHYGQLGYGGGGNIGENPTQMGDALHVVDLGTGRKAKALGTISHATCAILTTNEVVCWGHGDTGKLGKGHTRDIGSRPGQMGDSLTLVDLGSGKTAKKMYTANNHACAVRNDDSLVCWGENGFGQLGIGRTSDVGGLPGQMGDSLVPVSLD